MKMISALLLLVFVGFAMPQNASTSAPDSMQRSPCMMMKDGKGPQMASTMPGQCSGRCSGGMANAKCCPQMNVGACANVAGCGPMFPKHRFAMFLAAKMVFGMLFLGMMLILTVNILLTILVGQDMKKRGTFNGLWIAPLLIAGIPVSIVYAMFRLGDVAGEKK
jgi:hypothetical protein